MTVLRPFPVALIPALLFLSTACTSITGRAQSDGELPPRASAAFTGMLGFDPVEFLRLARARIPHR